jgi:hypothetical protein
MFDTKRLTLAAFLLMIVAGSGSGQTCAAFLPASDTSISSLKTNFATADFNQDGKLDIASASLFQVDILLNTTPLRATTASFSVTTIPLATEVNGRGIAVFDANRDGKPRLVEHHPRGCEYRLV